MLELWDEALTLLAGVAIGASTFVALTFHRLAAATRRYEKRNRTS